MLLVVAVEGDAIQEPDPRTRRGHHEAETNAVAERLARLAEDHEMVISHGDGGTGPRVDDEHEDPGLPTAYPLAALGAQAEGMIGYFFLQALAKALPGREVVSLICQTEVAPDDPEFMQPTMFVGPAFGETEGQLRSASLGWMMEQEGSAWRRVMAAPDPVAIIEVETVRALLGGGAIVICSGAGSPLTRDPDGQLRGIDAAVDNDLRSALLARELRADALMILTETPEGTFRDRAALTGMVRHTTPELLRSQPFPLGSIGPKLEAVCRFVESTGQRAMIGRLDDAVDLLAGKCGTVIEPAPTNSHVDQPLVGLWGEGPPGAPIPLVADIDPSSVELPAALGTLAGLRIDPTVTPLTLPEPGRPAVSAE